VLLTEVRLRATAADVEVELDGQVLFAECLPGVGEGFGFQSPVQRGQVGRRRGGHAEHELGAGRVANYAAPDGVDTVVASDFPGQGAGEGGGGSLVVPCSLAPGRVMSPARSVETS